MAEPKANEPAPDGARQVAAKPASGGGAAPPRGRKAREDQRAEIVAELHALRATLDEVVAQFRVRAGGQLAEVERGVQGSSPNGAKVAPPTARARAEMLRQVRLLRVKPRKGRVKDIVRLAELIEELVELLPGGR